MNLLQLVAPTDSFILPGPSRLRLGSLGVRVTRCGDHARGGHSLLQGKLPGKLHGP
jgi:hypothetical protein